MILDGAHNPAGARALAASLAAYFPGERITFVIGTSDDKDKAGILTALLPLAARVVFAAADNPRAAAAESLASLARTLPAGRDVAIETASSPAEALRMAVADSQTTTVCVAGSLFLIGEILAQATENTDIFSRASHPADTICACVPEIGAAISVCAAA